MRSKIKYIFLITIFLTFFVGIKNNSLLAGVKNNYTLALISTFQNVSNKKEVIKTLKDVCFDLFINKKFQLETIEQQLNYLISVYPEYLEIQKIKNELKDYAFRKKILEQIKNKQLKAIFSDVDGTLLTNSTPFYSGDDLEKDYADFFEYIKVILKSKIKFVLVTGAKKERIYKQIITPLTNYLGKDKALLSNLIVFCNSSTQSFGFNDDGEELDDEDYRVEKINVNEAENILKELARNKFDLKQNEITLWQRYYEESNFGTIPWVSQDELIYNQYFMTSLISRIGLEDLAANKPPYPYLYTGKDSDQSEGNEIIIRSFPPSDETAFFDKYATPQEKNTSQALSREEKQILAESSKRVKEIILKAIKERLGKDVSWNLPRAMSISASDKKQALEYFMKKNKISVDQIMYFGDHFTKDGNDRFLLDVPRLLVVNVGKAINVEENKAINVEENKAINVEENKAIILTQSSGPLLTHGIIHDIAKVYLKDRSKFNLDLYFKIKEIFLHISGGKRANINNWILDLHSFEDKKRYE